MRTIAKIVITGLGTGYLPLAPGTWGSAAVCAIYVAVAFASPTYAIACVSLNVTMAIVLVLASIGCVAYGRQAEAIFGKKDPSRCVIDEWAGQALSILLLPIYKETAGATIVTVGIAFFAFRFFDIIKPPPARQLEKLPYGWGVLLDDLAAGLYANVVCQLVLRLGFHLT